MDYEYMQTATPEQLKEYRKKRNAERNRDSRARKKTVINNSRGIDNVPIEIPENIPDLKPLKVRAAPLNKNRDIAETTRIAYVSLISSIYKYHYKDEINKDDDMIKMLRNETFKAIKIRKTFEFLNDKIIFKNIIKKYYKRLSHMYAIFSRVFGMSKLVNRIYPYLLHSIENYENNRSIINNLDEVKNISFSKEVIITNMNKLENINDKLLYGFFFLIPTRRIGDYISLINAKNKRDINDDNNWYYEGKLYINKTKNGSKSITNIPEELSSLIDVNNEYTLNKQYNNANIRLNIKRITKMVYGKEYIPTEIRHLFSTYIGRDATYQIRKETSNGIHSIEQQMKYAYRDNK